ncbi:MAG: SoxR reducing system RseC family protein [Paludibacter sp.]|jgi:sigma-E factor negative regulatory protein RseC|nr:SoxR reducing system RseC family protein [Paludibacter sp.]
MSQLIEHTGIINHIEGNHIRVSIIQLSACSSCHANGACSASDMDEKFIDVDSSDSTLKVGDRVNLYGQSSMGLTAVLLAFVIPFLLILVTLIVLRDYVANEALSGTIALSMLIPYYIILSFFNKKMKSKFRFYIKKELAV